MQNIHFSLFQTEERGMLKEKNYLIIFEGSGIERPAQKEFSDHTSQRPHVYGFTERQAENDLWSPTQDKDNIVKTLEI